MSNIACCFRLDCKEIVPPPKLFADGQTVADFASSLSSAPNVNRFSNAARGDSVPHTADAVSTTSVAGQSWTGSTGFNWMQQWLEKNISTSGSGEVIDCNSPDADELCESNNIHLSPVALVNEESVLGEVPTVPAAFPQPADNCLQTGNLANFLFTPSSTAIDQTLPKVVTGIQQPVHVESTQQPALL